VMWQAPTLARQADRGGQSGLLDSPTVEEILIPTAMRENSLPATIVLPSTYAEHPDRAFPVLYLLHGAGGTHDKWVAATEIEELAEELEMLVVCPDGGSTSWYFDSPIDPSYQFETFIAEELVAHIDANYRTRANAKSRAIAGLSMGGHGALFLGIRHSDVFATAVVLSGGVDIRPFPDNWDIAKRLGSIEEAPEVWEELTAINQARSLQPGQLALSIDCGVGDFFIDANRALHELLLEMKIEHDYTERPGGHRWEYWSRCLPYQMIFISEQFER
jgi:S-formylglutathione hydrolase FrmB